MDPDTTRRFLEKYPQLKHRQSTLEALEPEAWCLHGSWGIGRVQSVDAENNRIFIRFESQPEPKSMDLAFCLQKLQVLPETHVIVTVRKDLKAAEKLLKDAPCEFVVKALQSFPEHQATSLELQVTLKQALEPFFTPVTFRRWWISLQRKLPKEPLIRVPKNKDGVFSLCAEPVSHGQKLLEALQTTRDIKQKITLGIQLCQLPCLEDVRKELPSVLEDISQLCEHPRLTSAQRLEACWICSDIACALGTDAKPFRQNARTLVQDLEKLPDLAKEIPHIHHERLLRLLIATYPEDWQNAVLPLLKCGLASLINACVRCLLKHDKGTFLTGILRKWMERQELDSSLLVWIVKHRQTFSFDTLLAPLIGTQLFMCILFAIDSGSLKAASALAKELNKDTTLVGDLLKDADSATAFDLARSIMRVHRMDDFLKRSLLARFIRIFPEVQQLFVKNASDKSEEATWISQAGLEAAKKEYETLVNEKIPANKEAIAQARELGDLRENSEYQMARQEQGVLTARKAELEKLINQTRVIVPDEVKTDKINIGTKVTLKDTSGKPVVYTILGVGDSDPDKKIVSYQTPIAKAMLGRTVGESVTLPNGETLSVRSIQRYDA